VLLNRGLQANLEVLFHFSHCSTLGSVVYLKPLGEKSRAIWNDDNPNVSKPYKMMDPVFIVCV